MVLGRNTNWVGHREKEMMFTSWITKELRCIVRERTATEMWKVAKIQIIMHSPKCHITALIVQCHDLPAVFNCLVSLVVRIISEDAANT